MYNKTISHTLETYINYMEIYKLYGNYIQSIRRKLQKLILEQDISVCNFPTQQFADLQNLAP